MPASPPNYVLGVFEVKVSLQLIERVFILIALCLGLFILTGCQRSLAYSPQGWFFTPDKMWQKSFEKYDIEISQFQGRNSEYILSGTFILKPKTNQKISFLEVALLTKNQEIAAKRVMERPASETPLPKRQYLMWLFDKPLKDILEDPVRLKLTLKIEGQKDEILIPMNRESSFWKT